MHTESYMHFTILVFQFGSFKKIMDTFNDTKMNTPLIQFQVQTWKKSVDMKMGFRIFV